MLACGMVMTAGQGWSLRAVMLTACSSLAEALGDALTCYSCMWVLLRGPRCDSVNAGAVQLC